MEWLSSSRRDVRGPPDEAKVEKKDSREPPGEVQRERKEISCVQISFLCSKNLYAGQAPSSYNSFFRNEAVQVREYIEYRLQIIYIG